MAANSKDIGKKSKSMNMTEGDITRLLVLFAIPLLLGNIFQQLYNMVDTWVIGNFVSNEAFSAVGTVGPIINMLIGFFLGLSNGAGVVIAQYFGRGDEERVQDTVHTAILMTLVMAVFVTAVAPFLTPLMLEKMNVPAEVMPDAVLYLRIYFAGAAGLLFYNAGAAILQATGDSRRPFYFLALSAILNIIGDLFLVLVCHMGVEGVAIATIFAQGVSALGEMILLCRTDTCVRIRFSGLKMHWDILAKIIKVGIPAAFQMAVISFSNVFVQGYINYFGADVMSGWAAYAKIDMLMFLPMQSISLAVTTFVGQNIGVGQVERAKEGVRKALFLSIGCTIILMIPTMVFASRLVAFFNAKAEVVHYGTLILHWLTPFYFLCCNNQVQGSALRGAGDSRAPMFIMIFAFVIFRQAFLYILTHFFVNELIPVAMSYPAGWLVCTVILQFYYHKANLGSKAVVA